MSDIHEAFMTGPLQVNCQLLADSRTGVAILMDPGGNAPEILKYLQKKGLTLTHIINTHGHFDHLGGVWELQEATGCQFWIHEGDRALALAAPRQAAVWGIPFGRAPRVDGGLEDGQVIRLAGYELTVLTTPGHSPGGVCFHWSGGVVVGDTLFQGSIGRTDLPGGEHRQLIRSIKERLLTLPDDTVCFPGHGPTTTIGEERRRNPYLR
ncbi:MAG: MBL fold metallo-hydrolase [Magnetococcales bacterium]|nr:MBL fold metallo-hydrolase [Magnetococcales bacterium]